MSKKKSHWKKEIKLVHTLLQDALEVEHATIPPYFTAWVSIIEGHNFEAKEIIRSVLIEEMLHMTLVANIMNAVGIKPSLTHPDFVPRYPHILPHSGDHFKIHIEKFSKHSLKTFMKIEKPTKKGTKPKGLKFHTIGQFYAFVRDKVDELCDKYGEEKVFCGDPLLQIQPEDYYGSGAVIEVHNRDTFHQAVDEIVEQGEGADEGIFDKDHNILGPGDNKELAHYYRFKEIYLQRHYSKKDTPSSGPNGKHLNVHYDKVYPLKTDTHKDDYKEGTELREQLDGFARGYQALLSALEDAFTGNRSSLSVAIARMFSLKNQALAIIQIPLKGSKETLGLDFTPI